ncbi:MAG TPA: alpha/beta fold hydrolase [Pyrinomonadaceae bacterium]|nr:alpha/beta fold hydrolase [Pyrinomonadaceae bacterium]
MSAVSNSRTIQNQTRQTSQRLFLFPYAGGAASIYRDWGNKLPSSVEVHPVQLPGHGNRLSERLFKRVQPLVESTAQELMPFLEGSFAFFGHSMGAIISFELAHLLRRENKPGPAHLFLSGRPCPHLTKKEAPTYDVPEPEFIEELRRMKGTPDEVLEHPELMAMLSPILRADLEVCQTYEYEPRPPLDCPITVFGGLQDEDVSREQLEGWREYTTSSFTVRMFPGNHFYLHNAAPSLVRMIAQDLRNMLGGSGPR